MTAVNVQTETETPRGWTFAVEVLDDAGRRHAYTVRLSWSDYDHWSHGRVAPEKVVAGAFDFLLAREPASAILSDFDCAVIRRYFPEVDRELPRMV